MIIIVAYCLSIQYFYANIEYSFYKYFERIKTRCSQTTEHCIIDLVLMQMNAQSISSKFSHVAFKMEEAGIRFFQLYIEL